MGAHCRSKCGPATHSSSIPRRDSSRRLRRRSQTRSPGSSFPAPAHRESTSSTTAWRTRPSSSSTWACSTRCRGTWCVRVDGVHNLGTHFIIGRTIGTVFNPVVGGPDRVVNLESSVNTHYDALLVSAEQRGSRSGFRVGYAFAKAFNYANDDQIPFANGPIDPQNLRREFGPTPNDQRHRLHVGGVGRRPLAGSSSRRSGRLRRPCRWTSSCLTRSRASRCSSAMPAGACSSRRPISTARSATSTPVAASPATRCRWSATTARFGDSFNSLDLRVSRPFNLRPRQDRTDRRSVQPVQRDEHPRRLGQELLGICQRARSRQQRSGQPGYLRSSSFGQPVTTAGGVFGSGGPRALQLAMRTTF